MSVHTLKRSSVHPSVCPSVRPSVSLLALVTWPALISHGVKFQIKLENEKKHKINKTVTCDFITSGVEVPFHCTSCYYSCCCCSNI